MPKVSTAKSSSCCKAKVTKSKVAEVTPVDPASNVNLAMRFNSAVEGAVKLVGAHVGAAKGIYNSVFNATRINANAFGMFLKNQRTWASPPLAATDATKFKETLKEHSFDGCKHILPHGSYLINLGNPNEEKRAQSFASFVDDLKRCESLGILRYNFHPGSTVGECTPKKSIELIAQCINKAHALTKSVIIVLENMAGQGNVIGSKFEELAAIITAVTDKSRIGVCLDTCHLFAAGYDIRTQKKFEDVMAKFDVTVGIKYLQGVHLNDSKGELGSCKDRHENIGKGKIGLEAFRFIMNSPLFDGIPMILETPVADDQSDEEIYSKEISLLYSLVQK